MIRVEVGIRCGHLRSRAFEPGIEGVGEVRGLLRPAGGEVAGFVGVFAEVEDLGARTDDEFAVGFVVGRETGGVEVVAKPVDELPIALTYDGAGRAAVVRGVGGMCQNNAERWSVPVCVSSGRRLSPSKGAAALAASEFFDSAKAEATLVSATLTNVG